ncbi:MAG: ABC transporter permease [Chloroflexi bacterium]|nr:ABC transporter permease [Chloroflexota bacterium]MDA1240226.1 ABC transporter permease [Chloroflexota bacterium]
MTHAGRALRGRAGEALPALAFLLTVLVVWEVTVRALDVAPYLVPAPSRVWDAFLETRGVLPGHIRTTMTEALAGLFIACASGVGIAGLLAASVPSRRALYPLLVISQNIPMVVLAPLLAVWFGFGIMPKVLIVALIGFFPIVVSTTDGLLRADRDLVELARSLGAGRWQVLRTILIPSAVPAFFAGLQISAAYAVLGAVIGEWVGASSGLGLFIARSQRAFRVDQVFVAVIVIAAVSIALFAAVHLLARLAMPWQHAGRERTERGV